MTTVTIKDPINAGDARVFSILRKSAISKLNALNAQDLTRLKTVIVHLKTHYFVPTAVGNMRRIGTNICPRFPNTKNNKKALQKGNQNKNQHPKGNNPNNLPQNKVQERNLGSRNNLNLKSSMHAKSKIQRPQSNYRAVIPSLSHSKVVSGQIREISHVNTPNSNFSTIFTNVIQIANDEGVNEELLGRAFRAALPALRKLSHPDDKACEIFQAYVALKNGRNYVAHNSA
ncbi:hypothetical protein TNCV_194661 [Trichonephila clavipes]|nr:hypothetical protein TNCV_194661 [Trichonephila clavipes]